MPFSMKSLSCGLALGVAVATIGCAAEEAPSESDSQRITGDGQSLTAAFNTSDFNNVWQFDGTVGYFEGDATLVLQNASQPSKPLIKQNIHGGDGMNVGPFSVSIMLGGIDDEDATIPAVGDCVAIKTDGGPRGLSDAEIRASREFGAFVYVSDPLSGAPKRPAWGVASNGRGKVYETVDACLNDPDRAWSRANPNDKLTHAVNAWESGSTILRGSISTFELAASVALVNVSYGNEPLLLQQGFASSGALDVTVQLPVGVLPGDCIAVKNVGGGRGFSDEEARAKDEFGAFLISKLEDARVFPTSAACLADAAANHNGF